ncbi:organic cation transporter-like protein [Scylla paramamosain]|uniref:organic cation transporter-like protein n=1 Tax=Scylla paramamosain TaxID=85552 RepID=UPI003082D8C5
MVRQLDDLLTHLGTGRWSVLHFIVLSFCSVFLAPQALGGAFLAPRLEYSCRLNNSNNVASVKLSSLLSETNSSSFVTSRNECQYTIDTPEGKIIEECTEFHFDNSTFSSTFTSEYQLGCDRSYLQTSFQSMYMLGYFVASPVSGYLSDK